MNLIQRLQKRITLPGLVAILNDGAKPHTIKAKGLFKSLKLHGGKMVKKVNHPGVKGSHFLEKAYQRSEPKIQSLFYQGLQKHMDKIHAIG